MTDSELRDSTTADEIAEGEIIDLEIVDADDGFERPDSIYHFILLAVCAAVLVLSMLLTVRGEEAVVLPFINAALPETCSFRRAVGLDCPGCGLTRCFVSLGHGDVPRAFHFNPVGVAFFGVVMFQIPFRLVQIVRLRKGRDELNLGTLSFWVLGLVAAGLIVQWIVKMVFFVARL